VNLTPPDDLPAALHDAVNDSVVIDCETTGLSPVDDRIIEIAAARVRRGHVVATFHTLVNPGRDLPAVITELTGLTGAQLREAPTVDAVLTPLSVFLEGRTVVGHNVTFDMSFIDAECARAGRRDVKVRTGLCTADSARTLIPRSRVGRYRLSTLADILELPHRPAHRAATDVLATVDLLNHLEAVSHGAR
jgi:DNA polymerase-3 subunit epsilon